MSFLHTYMLWGLLGLGLPIIVHMLSRREKSIVKFGSIRFLKPSESDAARSLGLSQYLLLLLRLLFLALICFLISQPLLSDESEVISYWVEEGVIAAGNYQELLSKIDEDDTVQCFSFLDVDKDDCLVYNSGWQLIDDLNNQKDSVVVYSYSYLKYFKGDPIDINRNINWYILPRKETAQSTRQIEHKGNVTEWYVSSQADRTSVVYDTEESENDNQATRPLSLAFVDEADVSGNRLKDVIDIAGEYLKFPLNWNDHDSDLKVQVVKSIESTQPNGISWIPSNEKLNIEYALDNSLVLNGNLSKEEMLTSNLPVILSAHFNKIYTELEHNDHRVLDPGSFIMDRESVATSNSGKEERRKPIRLSWWLLIIPMFFLERLVYMKSPNS